MLSSFDYVVMVREVGALLLSFHFICHHQEATGGSK